MAKSKQMHENWKIRTLIEMVFDNIPYSDEVVAAQRKIESALHAEYDGQDSSKTADDMLEQYGSLQKLAALAGFSAEDAERWRSSGNALDSRPLKKELRRQHLRIWLTAAFCVFGMLQLFWLVYNLTAKPAAAAAGRAARPEKIPRRTESNAEPAHTAPAFLPWDQSPPPARRPAAFDISPVQRRYMPGNPE